MILLLLVIFAIRTNQFNVPSCQSFAERVAVITPVGNNPNRIFSRTPAVFPRHSNLVDGRLQQLYLTRRGRIEVSTERDSLAIDHHHPLRTLSAFGFSNLRTPFFAEAKQPSAKVSSHSSWPCSSSSDKNLRHILSHTPCSSHCCNRRQHVLAEGYLSGRSFHLAPLRRTQQIPSKTSRLLRGLRPPLGDCLCFGSSGSIFFHCSSVTIGKSFAEKTIPFYSKVYISRLIAQV